MPDSNHRTALVFCHHRSVDSLVCLWDDHILYPDGYGDTGGNRR